jgi:hypothetical protein
LRSEYLQDCLDPNSKINPQEFAGLYYRVVYDFFGRHVLIEAYSETHELTRSYRFIRKGRNIVRSEAFSPDGQLEYYTIYHHNFFGWPLSTERHFPDGRVAIKEPE